MALYDVRCACGEEYRVFAERAKLAETPCRKCGEPKLRRSGTGPSSKVVETLDNMGMARPIERLSEAHRIYIERGREAHHNAGTSRHS